MRIVEKASNTRGSRLTAALVAGAVTLLMIGGAHKALFSEASISYGCAEYGAGAYGSCDYQASATTSTVPPVQSTVPPPIQPPVPPTRPGASTTAPPRQSAPPAPDTSAPSSALPGSNALPVTSAPSGPAGGPSSPESSTTTSTSEVAAAPGAGNGGDVGNGADRSNGLPRNVTGPGEGGVRRFVRFLGNPLHFAAVSARVALPGQSGETAGWVIDTAGRFVFPLLLAALVYLFLIFEHRIDRSDPKLVAAKMRDDDEEVEFK